MKTYTSWIGSMRHVLVLLVLGCVPAVAGAEMVLHDDWARGGEVSIEGTGWRAAFSKSDKAVVLAAGDQTVRIVPFDPEGSEADGLVSCQVAPTNSKDETEVRVVFSAGEKRLESLFHFTYKGTLRITPGQSTHGVFVRSPVAVGVLPGEQLEDVLYRPERYPDLPEVHVPAENWFAGLLQGNNGIVACAWPEGEQSLSLMLGADGPGRMFEALKIVLDGKDLYLEVLAGPAIWHKEKLQLGYLERDVVIEWEKPFPATYKTQLLLKGETATPRTFVFRNRPNTQWRPEMGECAWPVWFEGDRACLRLGKKIPPRGEAVIFPMADGDRSLTGFLRRTPLAGIIARRNERAELPQGPRDAPNVGFVACGGTGVMRNTIFALGLQKREKEFLTEYADFLADYATIVQTRHAGFFRSIEETRKKLVAWIEDQENNPEVHEYLDQMSVQAGRVEEGLRRKMELYGANTPEAHIAHADRAAERLKELLDTGDPEVFPECEELIDTLNILAWGHAESAGMRFSMLAREWAQEAALACAENPAACEYARGIRASIRDALNGAPPW